VCLTTVEMLSVLMYVMVTGHRLGGNMYSVRLTRRDYVRVSTFWRTVVAAWLSGQLLLLLHLLQLQLLHPPQLLQPHLQLVALMFMVPVERRLMALDHVSMFARVTSR